MRWRVDVSADATEVQLQLVAGPDADERDVAELSLRLRDELRELDGVVLRRQTAAPPPGAKGGAVVEWGTLLFGVVSSGSLTALLANANAWLGRQRRGAAIRVKLGDDELELTGATSEEQRRLIGEWLARTATRSEHG